MPSEADQPNKYIPPEAERHHDYAWLAQNMNLFAPLASAAFAAEGRGVLWVDATVVGEQGGNPIYYAPEKVMAELDDADTQRLVREYDPACELVVYIVKGPGRTSSYRVRTDGRSPIPPILLN